MIKKKNKIQFVELTCRDGDPIAIKINDIRSIVKYSDEGCSKIYTYGNSSNVWNILEEPNEVVRKINNILT